MKLTKIFIVMVLMYLPPSYANPWVIKPGSTMIYMGGASIDAVSKKRQNNISKGYSLLKENIKNLQEDKSLILLQAQNENRSLRNSEIYQLEVIDINIEQMMQDLEVLGAINDHHFGYIYLEHGISENQSIGLKINHEANKNFDNNQLVRSNIFAINHKYQFLNYKNIVASFISKLQYSGDKTAYHAKFIDFAMSIGHSSKKKTKKKYSSFALSVRKFLSCYASHDTGVNFTINQGFEIGKGYFLDNYAGYEYIKGERIYGIVNKIILKV